MSISNVSNSLQEGIRIFCDVVGFGLGATLVTFVFLGFWFGLMMPKDRE